MKIFICKDNILDLKRIAIGPREVGNKKLMNNLKNNIKLKEDLKKYIENKLLENVTLLIKENFSNESLKKQLEELKINLTNNNITYRQKHNYDFLYIGHDLFEDCFLILTGIKELINNNNKFSKELEKANKIFEDYYKRNENYAMTAILFWHSFIEKFKEKFYEDEDGKKIITLGKVVMYLKALECIVFSHGPNCIKEFIALEDLENFWNNEEKFNFKYEEVIDKETLKNQWKNILKKENFDIFDDYFNKIWKEEK